MERQSRQDYINQMYKLAHNTFDNHRLPFFNHDANQCTLKKPDTSHYIMHATFYRGTLCVYGDCGTVVFSRYSGDTLEGALKWMGHSSLSYVVEKAAYGLGVSRYDGPISKFEPAVAVDDVLSYVDELEPEDDARETICQALTDAVDGWRMPTRENLLRELYEVGYDNELLGSVGMVPAPRIFYARAMCKRAAELVGK